MKKQLKNLFLHCSGWLNKPVQHSDRLILTVFTILITYQPFYLTCWLDVVEWGLYLPGTQAFVNGQIPYRDFFHLRGPLEIVLPGLLMKVFGETIAVYSTYFYVGSVLTLVFLVLIGSLIFRTRLVFYLMTFMVVAKTFPRVVFYMWGGMRYGWGILALLCAVMYFKRRHSAWIIVAGISSTLAFLTSAEVGLCCAFGVGCAFIFEALTGLSRSSKPWAGPAFFLGGGLVIWVPFIIFMSATHSLIPYIDSTWTVATRMLKIFPDNLLGDHPESLKDAVLVFLNPADDNFKYLTPAYCYLFLTIYFISKIRRRQFIPFHLLIVTIASYGFLLYIMAFRKIAAAQFEMALQPEKLLLFFLCEETYLFFKKKLKTYRVESPRWPRQKIEVLKIWGIYLLIFSFIGSTIVPGILRYNKRFPAAGLLFGQSIAEVRPLKGKQTVTITSGKAAGLTVPLYQAKDIEMLTTFFSNHTQPDEPVLMFPEYGTFNFIIDRPFVGRFPNATFSWMNDLWHQKLLQELVQNPPRYATMPKKLEPTVVMYLKKEENLKKYLEVKSFIEQNYVQEFSTPTQIVYRRKM